MGGSGVLTFFAGARTAIGARSAREERRGSRGRGWRREAAASTGTRAATGQRITATTGFRRKRDATAAATVTARRRRITCTSERQRSVSVCDDERRASSERKEHVESAAAAAATSTSAHAHANAHVRAQRAAQ